MAIQHMIHISCSITDKNTCRDDSEFKYRCNKYIHYTLFKGILVIEVLIPKIFCHTEMGLTQNRLIKQIS